MSLGQNTVTGEQLRSYVERIEALRAQKKELADEEAAIKAEAKANGFSPQAIVACIKIRAMKPQDRQEAEAMLDMYLHALGMAPEPPLFRAAGLAGIDTAVREQVLERMSEFVPAAGQGDIIVNMGGKQVRLLRDKEGKVHTHDVVDAPPKSDAARPEGRGKPKPNVPDTDLAGADDLGRSYARDNRPVIDNPFPYGDARRARFDMGWRKEAGSDGMGPDEDE